MKAVEVKNNGISEILFARIIESNLECNYHNHLEIYLTELGPSEAIMKLEVRDFHINPRDIAHGAVAYAILDTAMGMAIRTINRDVVTLQSSLNHTLPAKLGDTLTARGKIIKAGKKIILVDGEVYNQRDELVAIGRGTFYDQGKFCEVE